MTNAGSATQPLPLPAAQTATASTATGGWSLRIMLNSTTTLWSAISTLSGRFNLAQLPAEILTTLILSTSYISWKVRNTLAVASRSYHATDATTNSKTGNEEGSNGVDTLKPSPIRTLLENPTLFDPIRKPRNPIVLCHGLYGFDVWAPSTFPSLKRHYWLEVLDVLRKRVGAEVIVSSVPGTGSIQDRAKIMDAFLRDKSKGRELNFMAHSMGGLDCRQLLTHVRPKDYTPLSLTTISTPHRGSPFMDWCNANIGIGALREAVAASSSSRTRPTIPYSLKAPLLSLDESSDDEIHARLDAATSDTGATLSTSHPLAPLLKHLTTLPRSLTTLILTVVDTPAYANLTTPYCNDYFNPRTPDVPGVKYFSVAARTKGVSVFHPLWLPKLILDKAEEIEREKWEKQHNHLQQQRQQTLSNRNSPQDSMSLPTASHKPIDSDIIEAPEWGNDGLVSISSAKWGEFLGTVDNCDHWDIRGDGGFAAAWESEGAAGRLGWVPEVEWSNWLSRWWGSHNDDAHGKSKESMRPPPPKVPEGRTTAEWIKESMTAAATHVPFGPLARSDAETTKGGSSLPTPPGTAKEAKFNLERLYVALAKKLYDEGF